MADDEQFSLCWNNFNTNLSAGFHESLCRGDLVDVSLAAEGQIVKAHRLVLSVCSPFFRKMFTQMPSNTHAIVFLNNVSHSALKDLIQFMYCGEVNVKQDALPAFISTAESLQIKGLTDNDPAPQAPPEPAPTPPAPHVQQQQQQQQVPAQRVQRQQPRTSARYKIETMEDVLGDEKGTTQIVIQTTSAPQATIVQQQQPTQHIQTQQLQAGTTTTATLVSTNKRSAQRSSLTGTGAVKRSKTSIAAASNVIDPLDSNPETATAQPQQITVQTTVVAADKQVTRQQTQQTAASEPEYIDLPMELPTKSEPDYTEEHGEVAGDGEASYVEDDTYGDMRYDDSYFTENEDASGAQAAANTSSGGNVAATTSKAVIKQQQTSQSYSESSFVDTGGEQGSAEAQAKIEYQISVEVEGTDGTATQVQYHPRRDDTTTPFFIVSKYGTKQIMLKQHTFNRHITREDVTYWRCSQFAVLKCRARLKTKSGTLTILNSEHNHEVITKARKYGSLKRQRAEAAARAAVKPSQKAKDEGETIT
ncbi:modifier of mdg4-like isoform X9 [Scaptodrosophila lebanonensis]|uniref:Modifier of mdg4-like isoform X9 n=1 Tax=Drosophila lebanonensis TaxID=7225 RepID=A0A6J2TIQ7_DROLE|nr:modifier of mdg4-like isoform X9 [Scaptodrosophila lebanonensis]